MNVCNVCGWEVPEDEHLAIRMMKHQAYHEKYMREITVVFSSSKELAEKCKC